MLQEAPLRAAGLPSASSHPRSGRGRDSTSETESPDVRPLARASWEAVHPKDSLQRRGPRTRSPTNSPRDLHVHPHRAGRFSKALHLQQEPLEGPGKAQDQSPGRHHQRLVGERRARGGGRTRERRVSPRTAPHPRACVQDGGEARGQGISREPGSRGSTSVRPPGPSCGAESAPAPRPPSRLPPSSAQAPAPRRPGRSFRGRPRGALRWGWRAPQESGPGRGMPVRSGAQVSARRGERAPGSTHGRGRTSPRSRAGGGKPVTGAGGLPRVCGS